MQSRVGYFVLEYERQKVDKKKKDIPSRLPFLNRAVGFARRNLAPKWLEPFLGVVNFNHFTLLADRAFLCALVLSVVKHTVKEPFLNRCDTGCRLLFKRVLFRVRIWGGVPVGGRKSAFSLPENQFRHFIYSIYEEYGPARGELVLPAQEPTNARSNSLHCMVIVIA